MRSALGTSSNIVALNVNTISAMRSPGLLRSRCCWSPYSAHLFNSDRPSGEDASVSRALHVPQSLCKLFYLKSTSEVVQAIFFLDTITPSKNGSSMKKDDKHVKDRPDRKVIRHPMGPISTKSIIINLIVAFFLYLLRRFIAGGKSAITKYSRFIK
ncbi:uncharacterized protein LOC131686170 isoform X2 [Topomyia yanbarensis]|uniref:uncharacterized protein LOC131686170 isoform X2 n=1 Tax=Topomyia yanbarensis TaxID=2498891 RepID=UPI00273C0972|nr:uncharacterized protein LOC131686170 isoform X2 [Topomyia yanbarensis]